MDAEQVSPLLTAKLLVNAIKQEIFNRIFPTVRHDLVSCISPSLMRVSILDRYLNRPELQPDQLKAELKKIEAHLKHAILDIRDLRYWDFEVEHSDTIGNILQKSIKLMESQLAAKGIEMSLESDAADTKQLDSKPLLYTLLCLFCYIEDSDIENVRISTRYTADTISLEFSPTESQKWDIHRTRDLQISRDLLLSFARQQHFDIVLNQNSISLIRQQANKE